MGVAIPDFLRLAGLAPTSPLFRLFRYISQHGACRDRRPIPKAPADRLPMHLWVTLAMIRG